jgi:hypothetical protein
MESMSPADIQKRRYASNCAMAEEAEIQKRRYASNCARAEAEEAARHKAADESFFGRQTLEPLVQSRDVLSDGLILLARLLRQRSARAKISADAGTKTFSASETVCSKALPTPREEEEE